MKRYRVPPELRRPVLGGIEPRLRRSLKTWGVVAAAVLLLLALVPARKVEPRRVRTIASARTARVLAPPQAPKPPPPPVLAAAAKPQPPAEKKAAVATKPVKRPAAVATKPAPRAETPKPPERVAAPRGAPTGKPGAGGASRPAAPQAPVAGKRGQEAGARVASEIQGATSSVDQLLASLQGTIPAGSANGSGKGVSTANRGNGGGTAAVGALRAGLQGGRGTEALAGIDNLLQGTGVGRGGGTGRGVAKGGVRVVDDGVASHGDGASASGRDSHSLMQVVERYKAGVKFCYDNTLKKTPGLAGKLTLQMDIAPSGEVHDLFVVQDGLGDAALQRCILTQVASWRFPAIEAGTVRFTLPLVFSPPGT